MRIFKKLLLPTLTAGIVFLNSGTVYAVGSEKSNSVENRLESMEETSGFGYFVVERASGETEKYRLEASESGVFYVKNENLTEDDGKNYFVQDSNGEKSVLTANASGTTRVYDWSIAKGVTCISTTVITLDVYDTVSFTFTPDTKNYFDVDIGLWNTVNDVFVSGRSVFGSAGGIESKGSWTMAVGGYFSFAIRCNSTTVDNSLKCSGTYTY